MLSTNELNVIGNILNTSWGRRSTEGGRFPLGTSQGPALNGKIVPMQGPPTDLPQDVIKRERVPGINGDGSEHYLVINYIDYVSFISDQELQAEIKRFRDIAEKHCAAKIASLRTEFRGTAGRSLKIKFKEGHDNIETAYIPTPELSLIAKPNVKAVMYRGFYRYTGVYFIS